MHDHLDAHDQAIHAKLCELRLTLLGKGRPLVGDVVLWTNGQRRRISHDWDYQYQTSFAGAGSFFTSAGYGSFSGALQPPVFDEFLVKTDEVSYEEFWFFSHGRAGAGRGVQCKLPCRVWLLVPFKRSEADAKKHPHSINSKKCWGEKSSYYTDAIQAVMNPRVIEEPDYF